MKKSPCETCPHRIPMDKESWAKIAQAQREATPQLSRGQCAKLTRIERKEFEGLEARVEDCEGYSTLQAIGNYLLRKVSIERKVKRTEAGGIRFVSWHERTCSNPFLDSQEYFDLQDEFDAVGPKPESPMFKSDKQREAFIDDQIGMQRTTGGVALMVAGGALYELLPEPVAAVGGGLAAYGIYAAARGGAQVVRALHTQVQEHRNNS